MDFSDQELILNIEVRQDDVDELYLKISRREKRIKVYRAPFKGLNACIHNFFEIIFGSNIEHFSLNSTCNYQPRHMQRPGSV